MPTTDVDIEGGGVLVEPRRRLIPKVAIGTAFWARPEALNHMTGRIIGNRECT